MTIASKAFYILFIYLYYLRGDPTLDLMKISDINNDVY